jgi:hypothetical protein
MFFRNSLKQFSERERGEVMGIGTSMRWSEWKGRGGWRIGGRIILVYIDGWRDGGFWTSISGFMFI